MGARGPDSTCPGRAGTEPAAGMGRGCGGAGRPGADGWDALAGVATGTGAPGRAGADTVDCGADGGGAETAGAGPLTSRSEAGEAATGAGAEGSGLAAGGGAEGCGRGCPIMGGRRGPARGGRSEILGAGRSSSGLGMAVSFTAGSAFEPPSELSESPTGVDGAGGSSRAVAEDFCSTMRASVAPS
jgi:hypothetical protein